MDYFKKTAEYIQNRRILQHLLFWSALFLFSIPNGFAENDEALLNTLIMDFIILLPQIMIAYFFSYFVIARFLLKKKYVLAFILFVLGSYFFAVVERIFVVYIVETVVREQPFEQEPIMEILTDVKKLFLQYIPVIYSGTFIFLFAKYFSDYKRVKEHGLMLSKEKTEIELKTLKAQLNPHFLFNTLNNIYTLSLDNSPETPRAIEKLSNILDHVLYRCNQDFVSLSSEIELLENYIELEKLRYDERLEVLFSTDVDENIEIAPLILLSLVENAFKHGAGEDSGSPKIQIGITYKKPVFKFEISNTISPNYNNEGSGAIGLSNIRKQSELIYPNQYRLDIIKEPTIFTVILQINQSNLYEN